MGLTDLGIDAVLESCDKLFTGAQDTKTGRFAKVVLTPTLAIKLQKVFVDDGALNTMEWRGCTKTPLNSVQEIVSAKAFGNMDVGPKVHKVLLLKSIPEALNRDNRPDYRGQDMCAQCWTLAIVMQRMTGSLRLAQHLMPRQRAWFWSHLALNKIVQIIRVLHSLGYDHRDIRHDNIGFVATSTSVELYLMDYGYGRLLKNTDPRLLAKLVDAFCEALQSVGAPKSICTRLRARIESQMNQPRSYMKPEERLARGAFHPV